MNPLHKAIGEEILWAFLEVLIDSIKKDPKFSLAKFSQQRTYKQNDKHFKTFFFELVNAIKEGVPDNELKNRFLAPYFKMVTKALRESTIKGELNPKKIQAAYNEYRALPSLRNLSERDFYLFLTYSIIG